MTPDGRHQQPGRRKSDADDFRKAALLTAATDGLFPNWSRKRVAEVLGIILTCATIYGMMTTWITTRLATRAELGSMRDTLGVVARRQDTLTIRVDNLEQIRRSDAEAAARQGELLNGLVRLRCLEISAEKAYLAKIPCDSLLTPRQKMGRTQ